MKKYELAAVLAAGLLSFSACDGLVDDGGNGGVTPSGDLVLNASKTIIQANGDDAAVFEVLYNGEPVTDGVTIYDDDNNVVDLPSLTFTTTETGTYSFWAAYGTSFTETVTVTAIGFAVPELPDDPQPESTSFARKVLLTQFTGVACAAVSFPCALAIFYVLKKTIGIRVSEDEELRGLDLGEHGMEAYAGFQIFSNP